MDARIFRDDSMRLRKRLVGLPFDTRFGLERSPATICVAPAEVN